MEIGGGGSSGKHIGRCLFGRFGEMVCVRVVVYLEDRGGTVMDGQDVCDVVPCQLFSVPRVWNKTQGKEGHRKLICQSFLHALRVFYDFDINKRDGGFKFTLSHGFLIEFGIKPPRLIYKYQY